MPFLSPADIKDIKVSDDFFYFTDERFEGRGTARLRETFLKVVKKPTGKYNRAVCVFAIDGFDDPVSLLLDSGNSFDVQTVMQLVGAIDKVRWRSVKGGILGRRVGDLFPETPDGDTPTVTHDDILVGYEVKAKGSKDGSKTFYNVSFYAVDDDGNEIAVEDLPKAE